MKENKLKTAIGYIVGLGLGFLGGWALNESALVHQVICAGLVLWLVGSLVGAVTLVSLGWLCRRR